MKKLQRGTVIRVIFTCLLVVALLWFVSENRLMVRQGIDSIRTAQPAWVALCALCSVASLLAMGEVMYSLMRAGGVQIGRRKAWGLTFGANAWSSTLPGGPALSTVLQFQVQRSWGASVVVISWFVLLSGAISTMWLVVLGLGAVVFLGASISLGSLAFMGVLMGSLAVAVHWVATHPSLLERWVTLLLPMINRALRRPDESGVAAAKTHIRQLDTVHLGLGSFFWISAVSLANRLLDLMTLWAAVAAVTGDVPALVPGTSGVNIAGITLAYASAKIIGATGVTPGGLGPVEAALTATLAGTGMSASAALAAALIYRLISFFFITAVGWVVYAVQLRDIGFQLRRSRSV